MLSRLRHIGKMLLVALLVMSCSSCARWREAKEVIAEADRLLEYGEIIEDTALLAATINTFNGPLGYVFARNDLSKAYYHMARNFYHAHDYATAADYYIIAFKQLCEEFNAISQERTPYMINLQFQAMAAIVRSQLYADVNDDFVAEEMQMINAFRYVCKKMLF